jgi:transcription factor CON7
MSQAYSSPVPAQPNSPSSPGAKLAFHLQNGHTQSMDGRQSDYPQPGLNPPYPDFPEQQAEGNQADQSGTAQYPQGQDPRSANFSSSATPTSEYSNLPQSARSGSFPEYIQRAQPYPQSQGAAGGNMAHATSPSLPLQNQQANNHTPQSVKSDPDVPIDPSIAAASPTYPPHQQYSPHQYLPQDTRPYPMNPSDFGQPHGGWPGHYQTPHIPHYGHPASTGPPTPAMVSPVARPPAVRPRQCVDFRARD